MPSMSTHQTTGYSKQYSPELVKAMESIIKLPSGPLRWRAAVNFWLGRNLPEGDSGLGARDYNTYQLAYNKRLRDEQTNKFSATESGALRLGLSIPAGAWQTIKLFDPPAFASGAPVEDVRRNLRRLMTEFKEYVIPEKH